MSFKKQSSQEIKANVAVLAIFGILLVGAPLFIYLNMPEDSGTVFIALDSKKERFFDELVFNTIVFAVLAATTAIGLWVIVRRQRRFQKVMDDDTREPAFDLSLDIDIDGHTSALLTPISGKVREIVVMRNTFGSAGSEAGEALHTRFSSFAIDINGATHDIRTHHHHHVIDEHAQKLAAILGCPHKDTSYG